MVLFINANVSNLGKFYAQRFVQASEQPKDVSRSETTQQRQPSSASAWQSTPGVPLAAGSGGLASAIGGMLGQAPEIKAIKALQNNTAKSSADSPEGSASPILIQSDETVDPDDGALPPIIPIETSQSHFESLPSEATFGTRSPNVLEGAVLQTQTASSGNELRTALAAIDPATHRVFSVQLGEYGQTSVSPASSNINTAVKPLNLLL